MKTIASHVIFYHNYQDHKFSWGHQDCGITTMYVLIKFKGTTVTSKIMKQKRKSRRYQNTPGKLSLVKTTTTTTKATDVTDFPYTCLVTESIYAPQQKPFVEAFSLQRAFSLQTACTRSLFLSLCKSVCGTKRTLPDSSFKSLSSSFQSHQVTTH